MDRIATSLRVFVALLLCVIAYIVQTLCSESFQWSLEDIVRVTILAFLLLVVTLLADIISFGPSDSLPLKVLAVQYFYQRFVSAYFRFRYRVFLNGCRDIRKVQDMFLLRKIRENENTIYGKEHNFYLIRTREDFVHQHPLTDYGHYKSYVERACSGETNVMSPKKLEFVAMSSGTTGRFKKIPLFSGAKAEFTNNLRFVDTFIQEKTNTLQPVLFIRFKPKTKNLPNGIKMGFISAHMTGPLPFSLVPEIARSFEDEKVQVYVIALFGLAERNIQFIDGILSPITMTFFKTIEEHGHQLANDIENGFLPDSLGIEKHLKVKIDRHLTADISRAREIRSELSKGMDDIAVRLWPNLKAVAMVTTGAFDGPARILRKSCLKSVFVKGYGHVSSEGQIGTTHEALMDSLDPVQPYAFSHSNAFFEFIPEDDIGKDSPRTLFLDQIEVGKSYEVVFTTTNGFYRYRLGDVIKVVDKLHQNPIYEFLYRAGQVLNVETEKTPENVLYEALKSAENTWKDKLIVDYTATECPNLESIQDYRGKNKEKKYIVFVEVNGGKGEFVELTDEEKNKIDDSLMERSAVYETYRNNGSIQPIHVIQVRRGTFARMKGIVIKDTNNPQYKTPKALRNTDLLRLLVKSDVNTAFKDDCE